MLFALLKRIHEVNKCVSIYLKKDTIELKLSRLFFYLKKKNVLRYLIKTCSLKTKKIKRLF